MSRDTGRGLKGGGGGGGGRQEGRGKDQAGQLRRLTDS